MVGLTMLDPEGENAGKRKHQQVMHDRQRQIGQPA